MFNESFANFVGARGSAWFFRTRGDSLAADEADARWSDEKVISRFWAMLYKSVDSAFKAHDGSTSADSLARIAARDTVYARARRQLVDELGPQLRTIGPTALEHVRLDNAALLAHRIYDTDLDAFDRLWAAQNGDLRKTVLRIIELAKKNTLRPVRRAGGRLGPSRARAVVRHEPTLETDEKTGTDGRKRTDRHHSRDGSARGESAPCFLGTSRHFG